MTSVKPLSKPGERSATLIRFLRECGWDVEVAAQRAGISRSGMYWRIKDAGIAASDLARLRDGMPVDRVDMSQVRITDDGVLMSHADYALLRSQAAYGVDCVSRDADLAQANTIIATLTARVAALAQQCGAHP